MKFLKVLISLIPLKHLRKRLRTKYYPKVELTIDIKANTRCLVVAPHPDDETLSCGGLMIKYPSNFDCLCMASAGVKTPSIEAEARADLRIKEFHQVMDAIGIKNRWIFKTFGIPPMNEQIEAYFKEYCNVISPQDYDYIFLPHPQDNHAEHKYITNALFKKILKKKGFHPETKIVFYEVWAPIMFPNHYEDISEIITKKSEVLNLYKSQWVKYNLIPRVLGLNAFRGFWADNADYAEAYRIVSINKYLLGKE